MNDKREADAWLLLDNLETCVCVIHFDTGEILYANRKAREEFGLDEAPGQLCWQAFKGREPERGHCKRCPRHTGDLSEGVCLPGEHRNNKTNKQYKNIGSIVTWNGEKAHMQHFLDITESKNTESALEEALSQSRQLNDAKSEFLSRMSHEIRTPMNAVIGMTKIAKQSDDASEIKNCLDNIDVSAKQLRAIINDIFDISKIESRTLELVSAAFNFKKTMSAVYDEFKKQADAKKQHLTFILDDTINTMYIGDEARLSQVVGNLLSNAVKFTPEEGHITFSARQKERSIDTVTAEISVTDSGIGISRENVVKLFSPFEQIDGGRSRRYGGTGLGLVLCKNIVEMMDGEFNVKSEEGKGSNFSFTAKFAAGNDIPEETLEPAGEETAGEPEKITEGLSEEADAGNRPAGAEPAAHLLDFDELLPFINVKRGLENLKGNGKLYAVLLRSYQKNDFPEKIESHLSSADFKEAIPIAQALQSITVSIGLDDMRTKVEMLMAAIRGMTAGDAAMEKLKISADETKKLIPDLILAIEEGKLS